MRRPVLGPLHLPHARLATPCEVVGNNSTSSSLPSLVFYFMHLQFLFPHHLCGPRVPSQQMLLKPCPINNCAPKTTEVQSGLQQVTHWEWEATKLSLAVGFSGSSGRKIEKSMFCWLDFNYTKLTRNTWNKISDGAEFEAEKQEFILVTSSPHQNRIPAMFLLPTFLGRENFCTITSFCVAAPHLTEFHPYEKLWWFGKENINKGLIYLQMGNDIK